jgi:hypothetical protein
MKPAVDDEVVYDDLWLSPRCRRTSSKGAIKAKATVLVAVDLVGFPGIEIEKSSPRAIASLNARQAERPRPPMSGRRRCTPRLIVH